MLPAVTLHGFRVQGLRVENYARDGVLLRHVDGFTIVGNSFVDNDDYGAFPVLSSHGLIAGNRASGSDDTGIYVGQSSDVTVSANIADQNTVGFDIENSTRVTAAGNLATGNTLGLIVQGAPGLTVPNASDVTVADNRLADNNRPNPSTDPGDLLSRLPAGTGLLTIDADRVTITNNLVTGNDSVGIAVISRHPTWPRSTRGSTRSPTRITSPETRCSGTAPTPTHASPRSRRPTSCGTAREPVTAGLATSSPRRSQARCRPAVRDSADDANVIDCAVPDVVDRGHPKRFRRPESSGDDLLVDDVVTDAYSCRDLDVERL